MTVAVRQTFGRSPLVVLLEVDAWRSHACPFDGTTLETQGLTLQSLLIRPIRSSCLKKTKRPWLGRMVSPNDTYVPGKLINENVHPLNNY